MIFCRRYFFDIGPGSRAVIQLGKLYLNAALISLVNFGKAFFAPLTRQSSSVPPLYAHTKYKEIIRLLDKFRISYGVL
jgi:hypothetical protein